MRVYKREPLTSEEQARLVAACETPEEKRVIWTLLDTGMRVSEVANITSDNLDFQQHRVIIYGKRGKRRVNKLSPRLREILEHHIIANEKFGTSIRMMQHIVTKVASRAKIIRKVSPHVLRHTFAINALRGGVNIRSLMGWLGHDDMSTTQMYLNMSPEDVISDVEKMWK